MPEDVLVDVATKNEDHNEMRSHLQNALKLPFVASNSHGVYIPNGRDRHIEAADWLSRNTDMPEYKIRATLSRLPTDWPDAGSDSSRR